MGRERRERDIEKEWGEREGEQRGGGGEEREGYRKTRVVGIANV